MGICCNVIVIISTKKFTTHLAYVNHIRIRSSNQPVLSNEDKVSCSKKQWAPLIGGSNKRPWIFSYRYQNGWKVLIPIFW